MFLNSESVKTKSLIQVLLVSIVLASCSPLRTHVPTSTIAPILSTLTTEKTAENVVFDIALSSDGGLLAVYASAGVYLYDTTTLEKTVVQQFEHVDYTESMFGKPGAIAISPNKEMIAVSGLLPDTSVNILNLKTGETVGSIWDIPNAYNVDQLQFSPDGKFIYIRSVYLRQSFSLHCSHNGVDVNFALHTIEQDRTYLHATKIYEKNDCVTTSPRESFRFTDNNKFFLYTQVDMGPELSTLVNLDDPSDVQEYQNGVLYDISSNGKVHAIQDSQGDALSTTLIDAESGTLIMTIPYRVKLLNDEKRFLVRGNSYSPVEWGLWEDGAVKCHFSDLLSLSFDGQFSANNEVFITYNYKSPREISVWDVSSCLVINVINLAE